MIHRQLPNSDDLNWMHPINRMCSLNDGLVSRWQVFQGQGGWQSNLLLDLASPLYGNAGTLTGMVPRDAYQSALGRPGGRGSINFDGSNDYVSFASSASLDSHASVTLAFWIRGPQTQTQYSRIVEKGSNTNFYIANGRSAANDGKLSFVGTSNGVPYAETGVILDGVTWHHVVSTASGTTLKMYVDGLEVSSVTLISWTNTGTDNFNIGSNNSGGGFFGQFEMDDLGYWNRALSAAEVLAFYNDSRAGSPDTLNWIRRAYLAQTSATFIDNTTPIMHHILAGAA